MASCRHIILVACLVALFAFSHAQFFDFFGGAQSANLVGGEAASTRDARGNTGPIVFPPSAPGTETSGVRVGASGFGFVPGQARPQGHGPFPGYWN